MPDAARHRAKARWARTPGLLAFCLGGLLVTSALPACTHDFSVFDVSANGRGDSSVPGGEDAAFGGGSAAGGSRSGGGAGNGAGGTESDSGGAGTAGMPSNGGTAGASASGGAPSSGGTANTGGQSNAGGTLATGGKAATGGGSATGGRPATGGAPATGGRSGTGGASTLPTCAQKYGMASGYVLCTETATTCRFFANTANSTCDALCTGLRGTCSDQDNDDGVNPCTVGDATDTCATPRQNAICVCAR